MNYTRRRLLVGGSVITSSLLAGCFESPPGDDSDQSDNPEPESEVDPESESGDDGQADSIEDEPEDDTNAGTSERVIATAEVVDFLDWVKNEYPRARSSYRTAVNQVYNLTIELIEGAEDGDVTEAEVDLLIETARRYETIGDDEFGQYYPSHLNYRGVVNSYEDEIRRNQRRGEYELLYDSLDDFRQYYANRRTQEIIDARYPLEPVVGGPVDLLIKDAGSSLLIFEVAHQDRSGRQVQYLHPTADDFRRLDDIRISQSPYDYASAEVDTEFTELFESEAGRVSESTIRIHSKNEPSGNTVDLEATSVDSAVVYIQQYESDDVAEAAYDTINADLTTEGEEERWGSSWEKMLVSNGSENVYAHLAQDSEYIFVVDISTTPWENRPSVGGSENWDSLVASTWLQTD